MPNQTCILTTKDLTILEVMLDRCLGSEDPLAPIIRGKIERARVVFREDVPADVATLSSRVNFRIDGGQTDSRILSHDRMASTAGMFLPITTPRGLALMGLSEGQAYSLARADGSVEEVLLEKVLYQPESARREKDALARLSVGGRPKPMLRLVRDSSHVQPPAGVRACDGYDDPGPSAA